MKKEMIKLVKLIKERDLEKFRMLGGGDNKYVMSYLNPFISIA